MAIKRVVLFTFKAGTEDSRIDQFFADLSAAGRSVAGVEDFVSGPYSSDDNLNQGYTHAFVMTFQDDNARKAFGDDPGHQNAVGSIQDSFENVLAFDFRC
jgi:hypothetical protein